MIRPGIGYVRIGRFAQTTSDAFDQAIGRLEGEGMKSLVLDLRANSGGLLSQAVDVLDRLVPKGKLLVSTRGRIAAAQAEYRSTGRKKFEGPIIVLIDHASASAAEVVAGGLQDLDRALVVGTASFGNGTVQNQIRLLDGASLRLTIATIYTPSGRPIQRDGEYYAGDSEALSSARTAGSTFNTVSGRTVHDGGIQPDVVVDVRELTPIELEMIEKHAFRDFAIHHVRGHPARTAPSGSLGPGFQLTDAEWAELRHAAEARGVIVSDSTWTAERDFILRQTRMELAVARGSSLEGYKISTETDHQLQSALDLFPRAADLQLRSGAKPSGAGR
jgi:carboxyl-terminal processing protease